MRHIADKGLNLIKAFESFRAKKYICAGGYPTVGYGHVIRPGETFTTLSESEASDLLAKDVGVAERAVLRLIKVPLSYGQFDALVSFTFNLGSGALQRSTLRSKVNRGEYIEASGVFGKYIFAGGKKRKGLVRRREAERLLFLS